MHTKCAHCGCPLEPESTACPQCDEPSAFWSRESHQVKAGELLGDRFEVRRVVGRGGAEPSYLVWDRKEGRELLLEPVDPKFLNQTGGVKRLRQAFERVKRLAHPAIATPIDLFDWGDGGGLHLLYEPITGPTLSQFLGDRQIPLPEAEALHLLSQIASALDYAHTLPEPVVHGALAPEMIFLLRPNHTIRILGFGIPLASTPQSILPYMAPERLRGEGEGIDPKTDIYSLAAIAYRCFGGNPPFQGEAVRERVLYEPPRPIPGVPGRVLWPILAGLAKDPRWRPAQAGELVAALTGTVSSREFKAATFPIQNQTGETWRNRFLSLSKLWLGIARIWLRDFWLQTIWLGQRLRESPTNMAMAAGGIAMLILAGFLFSSHQEEVRYEGLDTAGFSRKEAEPAARSPQPPPVTPAKPAPSPAPAKKPPAPPKAAPVAAAKPQVKPTPAQPAPEAVTKPPVKEPTPPEVAKPQVKEPAPEVAKPQVKEPAPEVAKPQVKEPAPEVAKPPTKPTPALKEPAPEVAAKPPVKEPTAPEAAAKPPVTKESQSSRSLVATAKTEREGSKPDPKEEKPATPPPPAPSSPAPAASSSDKTLGFAENGPFLVRVGAYSDINLAKQIQTRLQEHGIPSRLNQVDRDSHTVHRVLVGPFKDWPETQKARQQIHDLTGLDAGWNRNMAWPGWKEGRDPIREAEGR